MLGFLFLLPLILSAGESVSSPRVAQVRLAETLAEADSIEAVTHTRDAITFVIVREGSTFAVTARTMRGDVVSLAITHAHHMPAQLHALTWLGRELADATAVTRLVVHEGSIVIRTDDGRRYVAMPDRANVAAESRWAASWNADES